jgi:ribonuclease E
MGKKLLIDAKQPEETRVVLLNGNRIEDFDQETTTKLQNKGNIYLARVTRVEPSLQAAFIEYGGNRHGFLAFSEIHPDYYRIPVEDRKALTEEIIKAEEKNLNENSSAEKSSVTDTISEPKENKDKEETEKPEIIGGSDEANAFDQRKVLKRYKIQEVISKRQIILVQVAKEERGNKGAALTTYISLAGRYCVLMPNTIRGGGVSRKISKIEDRKRLKSIIEDIKMPEGMAVIIRTAGSDRTKIELKKDFSYLQNLWNTIREKTVQSTAPILINEEGNLIKRTIRDLYNNDVNEVWVSGEEGFNTAKNYIKQMIPNHIKRIKFFKDSKSSIFQKYNVEKQLDSMHLPSVKLKSGGYIVINQTEALVAIDVNSGRATKERNIEETALKTNLEAAEEVARQLKLRDLSGLIVVDFIDMEGYKNQHSVEKNLKEAMSSDRARIQIGRISHFGLLELSRQRLRPSVSENYFSSCYHCGGTGVIRSVESSALRVLRKIEETNLKNEIIEVIVPSKIGMYILNQKRKLIQEIEKKLNLNITFNFDDQDPDLDCKIDKKGT